MKNKLTNTLFVFITIFTLFFSSCQVEEATITSDTKSSNYNVKNISKDEINTNSKIVEKLQKLSSQKNSTSAKNITFNNLGLTIQTDHARYIEDGNYHSYTFATLQKDTENIKNVLFSLNEKGEYDAYLVEYDYNKLDLAKFTNHNKPGEVKMTPINLNINSLTAKSAPLWVCKYEYRLVSSGDLVGAENVTSEWVLVASSCAIVYATIIGEDNSTTNYGNGTSSNTTNGYMNPTTGGGGGSIATSPLFAFYDEPEIIKIEFVKKHLNVGGRQKRFLEANGEVAFSFYDYLAKNRISEESKSFGSELLDIIMTETTVDLNAINFVLDAKTKNKITTDLDDAFLLSVDKYMDADMAAINASDPDLIIYFGVHHITKILRLKKLNPEWSFTKCYWEASKEVVHITLDAFGMVPVVGEIADISNGVLYTIEGDGVNATLSVASAVPIAGWATVSTKYAFKINTVYSISTKVKLVWKVTGDLITFGSRNQLRKVLGLAVGDLRQAHHIIPWNKQSKFAIQKASKSQHAFHMNEALNGIPLSNAVHNGSHAHYDDLIQRYLDEIPSNATPDEAYAKVMEILSKVRTAIQNNPGVHINQLNF
ncbi:AHH domain-containing protein [Flavobacterium sp. JAS]|uniref:AHH domain-containing protein n=1 Tax=Flavobacterium sp. JAS TaxID=2897329 RepID=UPI001E546BA1|nr:AHH domain-containing protein [Flavobacterium sp. JAS]MCD0471963.1 AHH domain-containing protein [Flavobacterium sp. JAS]